MTDAPSSCYECGRELVWYEDEAMPRHKAVMLPEDHAPIPARQCETCGGSGLVTRIAENQRGYTDSFRDPCPAGCRDGREPARESEMKG